MGKAKYIVIDGLLERLQEVMDKNGINYVGLAKAIGLNHCTVWHWFNYGTMPRLDAIIQISNLYGVSTDWLLKGK